MLAHSEAQAIVRTAIRNAGGVTKWARRFGIQRGSIYEWIERAEVPSDRAVIIERESHGVAKRQDLRPKDYWDWWPDLARPEGRE